MSGPDAFPWSPFHRLPVAEVSAAVLLRQAHRCASRQHRLPVQLQLLRRPCCLWTAPKSSNRRRAPRRSSPIWSTEYGADSVQFYDMNFFLREAHARELMDRIAPLNLRWWCEARVDIMSRYSDATMHAIKTRRLRHDLLRRGVRLGLGAGGNAERHHDGADVDDGAPHAGIRHHPRVLVRDRQPRDPERDTRETLQFIRKLKRINPDSEIIMQHYTPMPQPGTMYGEIDGKIAFPDSPAEWATKSGWTSRCASTRMRPG